MSKFTIRLGPDARDRTTHLTTQAGSEAEEVSVRAVHSERRSCSRGMQRERSDRALHQRRTPTGGGPDGTLVPVEAEKITETKKSELAKDVINLTVHDADVVNDSLFPADTNAYVFEPDFSDPVNIQWHSLITALLAEHPEFAYVGICNLRNNEGLFRIVLWRDRLVVQRLMSVRTR